MFNSVTHIIYPQWVPRKFKHLSMFTWCMKCSSFGPGCVSGLTSNISARVIIKLLWLDCAKTQNSILGTKFRTDQNTPNSVCPRQLSKAEELPVWRMMGKWSRSHVTVEVCHFVFNLHFFWSK